MLRFGYPGEFYISTEKTGCNKKLAHTTRLGIPSLGNPNTKNNQRQTAQNYKKKQKTRPQLN
ncbi:hypothetical protein Hanom_Chr04g00304241 [Helianthus anomalus]